MKKNILEELRWRNILNNITNEEKFFKALEANKSIYVGFDPSAKSLHLGNYVMIMLLNRFHIFGIKTYALIGGATGMIGDPSGKLSERKLLDESIVNNNKMSIKNQLLKYTNVCEVLDNLDNYKNMSIIDFLRDVGKLINVNYMLEKDLIKNRLETGISYTEFSYTLIQGYDFLKYYQIYNIAIQAGGSDQWGNITTGCEMIRKVIGEDNLACGITINLLLKSDGTKFGKSEKGAIYLDPTMTTPYEMYQFLINQEDKDVINLLKFLTLLSKDEINEIENNSKSNPKERIGQKILAKEIVTNIHGHEWYEKCKNISKHIFNEMYDQLSIDDFSQIKNTIPSITINGKIDLLNALIKLNIVDSNRKARELINNNSITINKQKIVDENYLITKENTYFNKYVVLKKGKKFIYLIEFNS